MNWDMMVLMVVDALGGVGAGGRIVHNISV